MLDAVLMVSVFVPIAIAVVCNAAGKLLDRHVAKVVSPVAYAWLTQIIAILIWLPIALSKWSLPTQREAWFIFTGAAILWTIISVMVYVTIKRTEVSLREPVSQSKIIWALLLGLLFLGEQVSGLKLFGTIVVFLGLCIALIHPERRWGHLTEPGVLLTGIFALLGAITAVVDKSALHYFTPEVYGLLVYAVPGIVLTIAMAKRVPELKQLYQLRLKTALVAIILSTTSYFFTLKAYSLADLTLVYPLLQLATILAVIGAMIFLKEREHRFQRIIAIVVVIAGATLVKIG